MGTATAPPPYQINVHNMYYIYNMLAISLHSAAMSCISCLGVDGEPYIHFPSFISFTFPECVLQPRLLNMDCWMIYAYFTNSFFQEYIIGNIVKPAIRKNRVSMTMACFNFSNKPTLFCLCHIQSVKHQYMMIVLCQRYYVTFHGYFQSTAP